MTNNRQTELQSLEQQRDMIEALIDLAENDENGGKLHSKEVWVQNDEDGNPQLVHYKAKKILPEYDGIPMLTIMTK